MGRDTQKIGDINELRAVIKFLKEGYYVFKNISLKGPIDMVLVDQKTGKVRKIDVKTNCYRLTWRPGTRISRVLSKEQKRLGVEFLFLDKEK